MTIDDSAEAPRSDDVDAGQGRPDPADRPKLEWGEDEERGGVEEDPNGPPNFDPEPDPTPPRLTSVDPGDDGGAYSPSEFSDGEGTPTDL